ncbi:MAG: ATP-binding protein, partial [Spirochaetaceae bacterium]|nr:ATP-binding protein [Spirochaetaceae bacterium]
SLLRPAALMAGPAASEKGIALSVPDSPLRVVTEREGAAVVFRNLLANAVKFTPAGGSVRVEAFLADGMVEVAVIDTGRGMDEAQVALLNGGKPMDSALGTAGEKGTGLGLSLCRVFLERQGGGLRVESESGSGSRFVVRFPAGSAGPVGGP